MSKTFKEFAEACWDSHKQVGTKISSRTGKRVPNCVPKNEDNLEEKKVKIRKGNIPFLRFRQSHSLSAFLAAEPPRESSLAWWRWKVANVVWWWPSRLIVALAILVNSILIGLYANRVGVLPMMRYLSHTLRGWRG